MNIDRQAASSASIGLPEIQNLARVLAIGDIRVCRRRKLRSLPLRKTEATKTSARRQRGILITARLHSKAY